MEMGGVSGRGASQVARPVRPELSPSCPHQHDGAVGNRALPLLPRCDVRDAESIIRVFCAGRGDVNHHCGADQLGEWDLIHGRLVLSEVNGAVEMRATVLARRVARRSVPVAARRDSPGLLLPVERFCGRPIDGALVKAIGEIDYFRRLDDPSSAWPLLWRLRRDEKRPSTESNGHSEYENQ